MRTLLARELHLIYLVGGKHRTDHLLAHLHVGSDSDRALRNRVVGQLAIPAERGRIILSARLARHGGGAVVAGQAHVALVLGGGGGGQHKTLAAAIVSALAEAQPEGAGAEEEEEEDFYFDEDDL